MNGQDIKWSDLAFATLSLIIPTFIFLKYKTALLKPMLIAFARMIVQLLLIGIYLKYIFEINSIIVNFCWVIVMIIAASITIIQRANLSANLFFIHFFQAIFISVIFNTLIYAFILQNTKEFFNARYIIPILGMLIGNGLSSGIIAIRTFYNSIYIQKEFYQYRIIMSSNRKEVTEPIVGMSLKEAFEPSIGSTATIGLIWLPGMMTGQILGGSDPIISIKYQISIIIAIFVGNVLTALLSIIFTSKIAFNRYDNLKSIFKIKEKRK